MTILKGYEHKEGSFTNKATGELVEYDSYILHYSSDDREEVTGEFCGNIKCKAGSFKVVGAKDLDALIGKPILMVMDMTATTPTVSEVRADAFPQT